MERKKRVRETLLNSTLSIRRMGSVGRIAIVMVWIMVGMVVGSQMTTSASLDLSAVPTEERKEKVKEMFLHAWWGYKKFAWAHDELKPVSEGHSDEWGGWGITLVDTLDTLIVMNLTEELREARRAVELIDWGLPTSVQISTFETTIRHLGGLLSAYTLTNDNLYLDKSVQLAERLLSAFKTKTGFPAPFISTIDWSPALQSTTSLAEVGSLQLEFSYLSMLTGNTTYALMANKFYELLWDLKKTELPDYPGLWPLFFDVQTGEFQGDTYSIGGQGDSTYEYFLKLWLLDGQQQPWLRQLYNDSLNGMKNFLTARAGRRKYLTTLKAGVPTHTMDHLSCFAPGMIALGAWNDLKKNPDDLTAANDMKYAEALAETCYVMYKATVTKIGPEITAFDPVGGMYSTDSRYQLRPETLESFFILYRITSDEKYQVWSWEILQRIERHCKTNAGYTGLTSVDSSVQSPDDVMQSFFLAETLKYLYLIFSDPSVLPLDEYIFSTEAHPFKIQKPT